MSSAVCVNCDCRPSDSSCASSVFRVAPKLIEAAAVGIGIVDHQFRRRGGRTPIRVLLSRRLNDAFDRRADCLDSSVDDGLDARCREHGAKRRPAERDNKANPERNLQEATDGRADSEAIFHRRLSLNRASFPGVRQKATLQSRLHRTRVDRSRFFPRLDSVGLDRWTAPPSAMAAGSCNAIEGPIADREPCAYRELEDTMCDDACVRGSRRAKDCLSAPVP